MTAHHNLMIEAGAGTGKTTRLVKAVLEALFLREIPLDHIVALTFTNKAAGELKERVSAALEEVINAPDLDTLRRKPWWFSLDFSPSLSHLKELAAYAVAVLDRADIATIHAFAYALIKRFPIAAGIHPNSEIDDKNLRFDELFRNAWPGWLDEELADGAPHEAAWLELLSQMTLDEIALAARQLADFKAPIEHLPLHDTDLPKRLEPFHKQATALAAGHSGTLVADQMAQACEEVLGIAAHAAWDKLPRIDGETQGLLNKSAGSPKSWTEHELDQLKILQRIARNVLQRGDRVIHQLTERLKPFVASFRAHLLSEGCLSHSALLFLSRELVRQRPDIREQLKKEIRLILIDEFQDTDPLQAELLLYLAEMPGRQAPHWEAVQLEPGKLFIVGDPKQSIYRFRGADIAAYEHIGAKVVAQGGRQEMLSINYRSQAQIITIVNTAFEKLMPAIPDISPPYKAVLSHHVHNPEAWPIQDVDLWLAASPSKPQTVEDAQDTEAEAIAQWIIDHVTPSSSMGEGRDGGEPPTFILPHTGGGRLSFRDIALIFRTYSPMDRFIDALRRHNIPFAVESERFFFSTPEVTDVLNLLRAIADPQDERSKIGYLKSPLAAITDKEILERKVSRTLDALEPLTWIHTLHGRLEQEPLANILQTLFDDSFLLELAARSYHGDQTVANLFKLRRLLEDLSRKGDETLTALLERLDIFFKEDRLEGESPLADESYDAVRMMTIHKAKGLEFPVVFLPSLHSEVRTHGADTFVFDWRKQRLGFQTGNGFANLEKILFDQETRVRDAAEQQRLLYVAMTRAKERLILSGGIDLKVKRSGTFLNHLAEAWGLSLSDIIDGKATIANTHLTVKRLAPVRVNHGQTQDLKDIRIPPFDPDRYAAIWKEREKKRKEFQATELIVTSTSAMGNAQRVMREETERENSDSDVTALPIAHCASPVLVGTLVHRFLEHWDFACAKCDMPASLRAIAQRYFSQKGENGDEETVHAAQRLLAGFIGSTAYEEIQKSEILAREMPFFYSAPSTLNPSCTTLIRGTMDILYRRPDGTIVIGDYKTGAQPDEAYANQAAFYQTALRQSSGVKALFKLIRI